MTSLYGDDITVLGKYNVDVIGYLKSSNIGDKISDNIINDYFIHTLIKEVNVIENQLSIASPIGTVILWPTDNIPYGRLDCLSRRAALLESGSGVSHALWRRDGRPGNHFLRFASSAEPLHRRFYLEYGCQEPEHPGHPGPSRKCGAPFLL